MKRPLKISLAIGGIFLFLLLLLVTLPFIFKGRIEKAVKDQVNSRVNAKVNYGDVSASLIRHFPDVSISISDISVAGIGQFEGDTLSVIRKLSVSIDIMSFIKSGQRMKVNHINIDEPVINAIVLKDGSSNWDIMKPDTSAEKKDSKPLDLSLKKISIHKARIAYSDLQSDLFVVIKDLDFEGSGDFAKDNFTLETQTEIAELSLQSGNTQWLKKAKMSLKADLDVNQPEIKYTFKENRLVLNELALNFDGFVQMKEKWTNLDLKFKADGTDFKNILSMVPTIYAKDFSKVKTEGKLSKLDGFVKGKYLGELYPAFHLDMKIENAMFRYPDVKATVSQINTSLAISNSGGSLDNTVISIPKLHFAVDNEPVDMSLYITNPMTDLYVDLKAKGKLDLAKVPQFYPVKGLKKLSGSLLADLEAKARMSSVKNVYAAGTLDLTAVRYESEDLDWPVNVQNMSLKFNPKNVDLLGMNASIGKSDFHATGSLSNFLPYFFAKDVIKGQLTLQSSLIDLNELQGQPKPAATTDSPASTPKDKKAAEPIKVPSRIDFTAQAKIGKVLYQKITMDNVSGEFAVHDESLDLSGLSADVFGGRVSISGLYNTKGAEQPQVNFAYNVKSIDFQKTFEQVPSFEKLTPVAKYLKGIFSSDLNLVSSLNNDMTPDYNSLTGKATVKVDLARLVNMPVVQKIAEVTQLQALQNPEIRNAWTELKFLKGRVYIEKPLEVKLQDYKMTIIGSNGFDKSMDYTVTIDVPSSKLGAAQSVANDLLKKSPIPGLQGLPEMLTFNLKVGGTVDKPIIKLGPVSAQGKSIQQQVVDNVKQEAEKQANELLKKAQEEAQKEAQKQVGDAIGKQAGDQINKAKEEISKRIKLPW